LPPIPLLARHEPLLCSFAQERLWFIDQLEPGNPAYNLPAALRATGGLDARLLERCLSEVLRRHQALRTVFPVVHGQPRQRARPPPRVDLAALPAATRRRESERLARADAVRPFDLAAGPLARATLLLPASGEHALLLNIHHIVSDGWSTGVLIREVGELYRAF